MISFRRCRPLPPAPPEDAPVMISSRIEAEIAVGSLSGIAPSDIERHALVVLDAGGAVRVFTSCCRYEVPELLVHALHLAVDDAAEPGPCHHGALSAAGHWEVRS